jgi:hypothetical protein
MTEYGEKRPNISERTTSVPLYVNLLLDATFHNRNRAIDDRITAIDFGGPFTDTADELNHLTQSDSLKREYGTIAYATPNQTVLIRKDITQGNEMGPAIKMDVGINRLSPFLPRTRRQKRFVGSVIHSHPLDTPPSPADIAYLLLSSKDSYSHTSAFIVTPERKIMVFRGLTTPQLSLKEVKTKINLWTTQVNELIKQCVKPGTTPDQIFDIALEAQHAITRQIVQEYGLRYFNGLNGQSVARLNPPGQL